MGKKGMRPAIKQCTPRGYGYGQSRASYNGITEEQTHQDRLTDKVTHSPHMPASIKRLLLRELRRARIRFEEQ